MIWVSLLIFASSAFAALEPPIIQPLSINKNIVEGQKIKLGCTVTSGSVPLKFEWFHNDFQIVSGKEYQIRNAVEDSSDLVINPISTRNSGSYKCVATNVHGMDSTKVEIEIKGANILPSKTNESLNQTIDHSYQN